MPTSLPVFQLTASQGGWLYGTWFLYIFSYISTHSLTRRLTLIFFITGFEFSISTHSLTRRLTIHPVCLYKTVEYFNSQPHKEADWLKLKQKKLQFQISTHSLTRRLTACTRWFCTCIVYFNSQPHKEADLYYPLQVRCDENFNSQPHKEADRWSLL